MVQLIFYSILIIVIPFHVLAQEPRITKTPGYSTDVSYDAVSKETTISGGHQAGNNLFHSFDTFNLYKGESAQFKDTGIKNTIGRITGNSNSWINGRIHSYADNLYLINPNGFIFGPHASLDLAGSFYVSTADYINFDDNNRFYANLDESSSFSMTSPQSFGFLDNHSISPILIQGAGEIDDKKTHQYSGLVVEESKSISVIGGKIDINGTYFFRGENIYPQSIENLLAPGGRVNIVAVGSGGEVILNDTDIDISSFDQLETITLDHAKVSVEGNSDGNIFFRGESSSICQSEINAFVNEGNSGNIDIITRNNALFKHSSLMSLSAFSGSGGNIRIKATNISLTNKTEIYSVSVNGRTGGDISIIAQESIHCFDNVLINNSIYSNQTTNSDAGIIFMQGKNISFIQASGISSQSNNGGKGGNIHITASDSILFDGMDSTIHTNVYSSDINADSAGYVSLEAEHIKFVNNAGIFCNSVIQGNAGYININAKKTVTLQNNCQLTTNATTDGGGQISIHTPGTVGILNSSITTNVKTGEGNAGDINISSGILLLNHSKLQAYADGGDGGAISIRSEYLLKSTDTIMDASSNRGNEGTVQIDSPDIDISSDIVPPSSNFLDTSKWVNNNCQNKFGEAVSRLVVSQRDGTPQPLDDWLHAPLCAFVNQDIQTLPDEIKTIFFQALDDYHAGYFGKAIEKWLSVIFLIDNNSLKSQTYLYIADAYQKIGHYRNAYQATFLATGLNADLLNDGFFKEPSLIDDIKFQNNPENTVRILNFLTDLCLATGHVQHAENALDKSLKIVKNLENPFLKASVYNQAAIQQAVTIKYDGASSHFQKAMHILEIQSRHNNLKSKILINMIRLKLKSDNVTIRDILPDLDKTYSHLINSSDDLDSLFNLISFSHLCMFVAKKFPAFENNLYSLAQESFRHATQQLKPFYNLRVKSYIMGYQCLLHLNMNSRESTKLMPLIRQAIFLASEEGADELLYLWQWQMARIQKQAGEFEKAEKAFENSIQTLDTIRKEFHTGYKDPESHVYSDRIRPVYLEYIRLLLAKKDHKKSQSQQRLLKTMNTMDLLKKVELQEFYNDECIEFIQSRKTTHRKKVFPQTAIIYPICLKDCLVVLIKLPDLIVREDINIGRNQLKTIVNNLCQLINDSSDEQYKVHARELYKYLIQPIEKHLYANNIHTFIISADNTLRPLPVSVLFDGKKFLIEKFAIATIPGISLTDASYTKLEQSSVLLNGLSVSRQGFESLKYVEKELSHVKAHIGGDLLLNKTYTSDGLIEAFRNNSYSIIHMATHGRFAIYPEHTFLLAYDRSLSMDDLSKLFYRVQDREVDLLTLSACETALGDERAALGMAGIAIKAGVKSVVASLWAIEDQSTSIFINTFYNNLKKLNISKAHALQAAQKKMIHMKGYHHPKYWAPFILIGNWL
ncbi:secreted protein containing Filamentous hemagglutinin [Candidatus Magnetomorum sp. HK-1]|nr:secreted protein containing Filamentous hemagglutinin [Candidatus Magnetomorum sp. HK-1]